MSIPTTHTGEHTTVLKVSDDGLTFIFNRRDIPDLREQSEITVLVMRYRQPSVRGKLGIVTMRCQPNVHQGEAHGWWLPRRVLRGGGHGLQLQPVHPTPATHAILRLLKAGESVLHTLFVPKRVFFTLNTVFDVVFQTLFVPKKRLRHFLHRLS